MKKRQHLPATLLGLLCLTMIMFAFCATDLPANKASAGEQATNVTLGQSLAPPGTMPAFNQLPANIYRDDDTGGNTLDNDANICADVNKNDGLNGYAATARTGKKNVDVLLANLQNNKMRLARLDTASVTNPSGHAKRNAKIQAAATRDRLWHVLTTGMNNATNGNGDNHYAMMKTASDPLHNDAASANKEESWQASYSGGMNSGHTVANVLRC